MSEGSGIRVSGDLGGTNFRLSFLRKAPSESIGTSDLSGVEKISTPAIDNLANSLEKYCERRRISPGLFVLSAAGPVSENRASLTNLGGAVLDGNSLADVLGAPCILINDFEAQVYGVAQMVRYHPESVTVVRSGVADPARPIVVIGPGSGLGIGRFAYHNGVLSPYPSEGGHVELAHPLREIRCDLYDFLLTSLGVNRVSAERVLSGSGVASLHEFSCKSLSQESAWRTPELTPAQISRQVLAHVQDDPACEMAVRLFLQVLGCLAGDKAQDPISDVVLVGNLLSALKELLIEENGYFQQSFLDKGRSTLMEGLGVSGIFHNDNLGLLGAAVYPAPK